MKGRMIMKNFFNDRKLSYAISALCFTALGIVLFMWPSESIQWICRLLGIAIIISGISFIISYFTNKKLSSIVQFDLVVGIILALFGIWLLTNPTIIISLIQYIFGAILIFHGIIDLIGTLNLRRGGNSYWSATLLFAIATIVFGAVIIYNPFASVSALIMLIGIALIYDGISDILIIIGVAHLAHKLEKAAKQLADDANVIETDGEVEK